MVVDDVLLDSIYISILTTPHHEPVDAINIKPGGAGSVTSTLHKDIKATLTKYYSHPPSSSSSSVEASSKDVSKIYKVNNHEVIKSSFFTSQRILTSSRLNPTELSSG